MNEREIEELLKAQGPSDKRRGWRCPDENKLAAYVNGQLQPEKRNGLEAHIADCKSCLQTLTFLTRTLDTPESSFVPAHLLVRARGLVDEQRVRGWQWQWTMATATACILIVVGVVVWRTRSQLSPTPPSDLVAQQQPSPEVRPPAVNASTPLPESSSALQKPKPVETPQRSVRGENDEAVPTLISPREGAVIKGGQPSFSWKSVTGATLYEVRVVTEDGAPVLSESTTGTQLNLNTAALPPGKYFVTIVARLGGGRTVKATSSVRILGVRRPGAALLQRNSLDSVSLETSDYIHL
jgi:hypothetical protein